MPRKKTKQSSQPNNTTQQPPTRETPLRKRSATPATQSNHSSGAKRQKTSQKEDPRPLTTDDLPILIKEVCNNLRKTQEDADLSDDSRDGQRRTTRQIRRKEGVEQNSLPGSEAQGSPRNDATTRRETTRETTSRRNTETHDNEGETVDGELNYRYLSTLTNQTINRAVIGKAPVCSLTV